MEREHPHPPQHSEIKPSDKINEETESDGDETGVVGARYQAWGTQGSRPYITPLTRDGLLAPIARIPNPSV